MFSKRAGSILLLLLLGSGTSGCFEPDLHYWKDPTGPPPETGHVMSVGGVVRIDRVATEGLPVQLGTARTVEDPVSDEVTYELVDTLAEGVTDADGEFSFGFGVEECPTDWGVRVRAFEEWHYRLVPADPPCASWTLHIELYTPVEPLGG
jgi:hypothetical protein